MNILRAFDFWGFTIKPEMCVNWGEDRKRNMLSTNRQSLWWWPPSSTPLISGLEWISWANGSMARAKRSGNRGHLVPRFMGKGSDFYPVYLTT